MIRNELMPKIISRWPSIGKSGKLSAEAKWNQKILTEVAREDLDSIDASKEKINMNRLKSLSYERQKNAIVFWLNNENDFYVSSKFIFQILSSISKPSPESSCFIIHSDSLNTEIRIIVSSKEIRLLDQGSVRPFARKFKSQLGFKKSHKKIPSGELSTQESYGKGLDKKYLRDDVIVKARVGGERCKPFGRDKSQKIKNLFQEFEIPDWKRDSIPLIYINDQIAAVGDLWVCDEFHTNLDENGISIVWNDSVNK